MVRHREHLLVQGAGIYGQPADDREGRAQTDQGDRRRRLADGLYLLAPAGECGRNRYAHANRTRRRAADDDERLLIDLQAIDSNIAKIAFVVTIHNAQAKRQTFGMIDNSYVRLLDAENNEKELCRFNLKEDGSTSTSVIFAELYKAGSEWEFKAVGEGRIADLNGILALYA